VLLLISLFLALQGFRASVFFPRNLSWRLSPLLKLGRSSTAVETLLSRWSSVSLSVSRARAHCSNLFWAFPACSEHTISLRLAELGLGSHCFCSWACAFGLFSRLAWAEDLLFFRAWFNLESLGLLLRVQSETSFVLSLNLLQRLLYNDLFCFLPTMYQFVERVDALYILLYFFCSAFSGCSLDSFSWNLLFCLLDLS
jgi:hypothetical protein